MQTPSYMDQICNLQHETEQLEPIVAKLKKLNSDEKKFLFLITLPRVKQTLPSCESLLTIALGTEDSLLLASLCAIGQAESVFQGKPLSRDLCKRLLTELREIENLYSPIGGIVGYHYQFLKRLLEKESSCEVQHGEIERAPGFDLEADPKKSLLFVKEGIERLHEMAEIYPVAGAADRLDLHDEVSGEPLPAAELIFDGHTLLEGLVRDLQAREYLHFKLTGKRIQVPVALMTSQEKNNHIHISAILEKNDWFGRPKTSYYFITQPLSPVIYEDGTWTTKAPGQLFLKPGGHGVLWKMAENQGAFRWLKRQNKHHLLIRQINNPIAGLDNLLLALPGYGCKEKRSFGFTSCERIVHSAEGMIVLFEHPTQSGPEYKISNIEYTDFELRGIQDQPVSPKSPYSLYPGNTNLLFANLRTLQQALKQIPFPGLLINLKNNLPNAASKTAGRLESIMQNIADAIITKSKRKISKLEKGILPTFVLYNRRLKTIGTTKKSYKKGSPILETPEGAYFQLLQNHEELLKGCGFELPQLATEEKFLLEGPSYVFHYHPALGPLYSIIRQKIKGGTLSQGSELSLEIAELMIERLNLKGSLIIQASNIMGHRNSKEQILYSHQAGKCYLENVKIENFGIDRSIPQNYWKQKLSRKESLQITIEGNGEFYAKDVHFKGSHQITVPDGHRMSAIQEGKNVKFILEKIGKPSWHWSYSFAPSCDIQLTLTF